MNNLEVSCNVCGWTGKRLLKHLELKEACKSKTDMEMVKAQLKEREKQRKSKYHKNNRAHLLKKKKIQYETKKMNILEKRQAHHLKNKDIILQKKVNHYEANKADILEKRKAHHLKNKDNILQMKVNHYKTNRLEILSKKRVYYQRNRVKILQMRNFEKKFYHKDDLSGFMGYWWFTTEPALHMFRHSLG